MKPLTKREATAIACALAFDGTSKMGWFLQHNQGFGKVEALRLERRANKLSTTDMVAIHKAQVQMCEPVKKVSVHAGMGEQDDTVELPAAFQKRLAATNEVAS